MSSEEKLRGLEGSINTLIEKANELLSHARGALKDAPKRERLSTVKNKFESAVLDYQHRFEDYNESLTYQLEKLTPQT